MNLESVQDKSIYTYDVETLSNCFTYTAINRDTKEVVQYVVWEKRNDFYEFLVHLSKCKGQIGFNSILFDYPVLHYIIKNRESLIKLSGDQIAKKIYKEAQKTIEKEYSSVKEEEVIIPQLDLFQIHHFFNKARMVSLKKLEIALQWENVQDMPIHHSEKVKTEEQIEQILEYNLNDVLATAKFYEKTIEKIELRKGLIQQYGLNCLNYPDSKIGEQLMLKLYCHYTQQSEEVVKKLRTHHKSFKFNECIPSYISFSTPEFNELLEYLKPIEVPSLKESFKYSFTYNDFTFDLGTGGIHGCCKSGVYESNEEVIIVDCDVASLYPSLAIANNLYPAHLGEIFSKIYEDGIVKPRLEAKKNGNKVMADGYKLSANSVYGKSNSEFSFLYDPLYTLKTTLAGQLSLCMLSEMLITQIPQLKMLQINTDGLTVQIPVDHKYLYWEICQEWEKRTKLTLEYVAYSKMIIRDVSSYIAISQKDGKVKYKGCFKPTSEIIKDNEWQKSFSQNIVALAVSDYFLKNIPVEKTIKEHDNIYDFCKTFNATHGWKCETLDINDSGEESNHQEQQKNNRYYISPGGKRFRKIKDEKIIEIEAGRTVVIFNKYISKSLDEYDLDYQYYIDECYKLIHTIDGTAERLEKEAKEKREREKRAREEEKYIEYCVSRIPTQRMFDLYKKDWLIEKYGIPCEIKPSKSTKKEII